MNFFSNSDNFYSVVVASVASSVLSMIGSLFIMYFYLRYKEFRNFAFHLIFLLSITDLIEAVLLLLVPILYENQSSSFCSAHGFLINYFNLSSVLWTSVIAISIYLILHYQKIELQKYMFAFVIYAVVLPLIISTLPFIWNDYGPAPGWCWIKNAEDLDLRIILTIIEFYGPLWAVFILNFVLYWKSHQLIDRYIGNSDLMNAVAKLKYYPLILVICWTPGTINRLYTLTNDPEMWMVILHCFFGGLQGFLNAITYGTTYNVKKELKTIFARLARKFKGKSNNIKLNEELTSEQKLLIDDEPTIYKD